MAILHQVEPVRNVEHVAACLFREANPVFHRNRRTHLPARGRADDVIRRGGEMALLAHSQMPFALLAVSRVVLEALCERAGPAVPCTLEPGNEARGDPASRTIDQ